MFYFDFCISLNNNNEEAAESSGEGHEVWSQILASNSGPIM